MFYAGIQATLHNAHFRRKGQRAFRAEDFLPRAKVAQTVEQKKSVLRMMLTASTAQLPRLELPPQAEESHVT